MEIWYEHKPDEKILKKIFCLPPVPALLISVPAYGLVIYALAGENVSPVIAYVSYFLSAYALVITVTGIAGIVRFIRHGIEKHPLVRKAMGIPLVSKYLREDTFRAEAALYQGFFINLLYAGIKMFSGILYRSVWFATLAVYYVLLAVMRASLLLYVRNTGKKFRKYASPVMSAAKAILANHLAFICVNAKRCRKYFPL